VIVEQVEIDLERGFTVLTGETGAGKSILIDALELLVGARAGAPVVRQGCERAELSAEFDVDTESPLARWLDEQDMRGDPGCVLVRRSIDAAGRSRCFINGRAATLAQLREAGERLVDIHGQHEHQSLLRPAAQRDLLDAQSNARELAQEVARLWREFTRLEALAAESRSRRREREEERAELADRLAELKRLEPAGRRPGRARSPQRG
jgi:DNA repair protein RecN (Recombination protein N)